MNGNGHNAYCHPSGRKFHGGDVPSFPAEKSFMCAVQPKEENHAKSLKICADNLAVWKNCVNTH